MNNRLLKLIFLLIVLAFMVFRLGILSTGFRDSMHDKPLKPPGVGTVETTHFRAKYMKRDSCRNGELYASSLVFSKGRGEGMARVKGISNGDCEISIPFLYQIHKERWLTLDFSRLPDSPCELSCLLIATDTKMPRLRIALAVTDTIIDGFSHRYYDLQSYQGLME